MSEPIIIVSPEFDRGIVSWMSAVANEYAKIIATGSMEIMSVTTGDIFAMNLNGTIFDYTAIAGDGIAEVLQAFKDAIDADAFMSPYLATSIVDDRLELEAKVTLYSLFITASDNMTFYNGAGVVIIWEDQNAYNPNQDIKPPYPYIVLGIRTRSSEGITSYDKGDNDEMVYYMNERLSLSVKFYSTNNFTTFATYCSTSYLRNEVRSLFLRPFGVTITSILDSQNISEILNAKTELIMSTTFSVAYVSTTADTGPGTSWIECVEINGVKVLLNVPKQA